MPPVKYRRWSTDRRDLCERGVIRVEEFCSVNGIDSPSVTVVPRSGWDFGACAYYRPNDDRTKRILSLGGKDGLGARGHSVQINVCLELCGSPCTDSQSRNWTWPGSVTDREPYGVVCHELGHHCDWLTGDRKGSYYSEYCEWVKSESGESGLTSYANENPAEWFAEAFRLFVTNHGLLKAVRPRTYRVLSEKWLPVGTSDWRAVLGSNVPPKILQTLINKGAI